MKPRKEKAQFVVNSALLEELGERLVGKPEIALAELVKNSYDADAKECAIILSSDFIQVRDDGHGMTESEFKGNWMMISSPEKGRLRFSRKYDRSMAGSKGVGRFSARYLGNRAILETVADDPRLGTRTRLSATFDWRKINTAEYITSVVIPYTVEEVDFTVALGTKLTINDLRPEASQIATTSLKSDLIKLTNPAAGLEKPPFKWNRKSLTPDKDPGFSVKFESEDPDDWGSVADPIQKDILDAYVGRVRLTVDETGKLDFKVFWRGHVKALEVGSFRIDDINKHFTANFLRKKGEKKQKSSALGEFKYLPVATKLNSPVFLDLRFFPQRKGTFTDLGLNGSVAKSWIRDNASFAIVDNNFTMAAYADAGSDWLGIDASKAINERSWQSIFTEELYCMGPGIKQDTQKNPMLALPRGSQLIGRVHIATRKMSADVDGESGAWLQPNMDRESLKTNEAFNLLWHISRFAVELLAHFDRKTRLEAEEEKYAKDSAEAKNGLAIAINELRASTLIEPDYKEKVVAQLEAVGARFVEAQAYEKDARISLELMAMMGVMAGFMTHEFEKAMHTLQAAAASLRDLEILDPKLKVAAANVARHELALANYLDYMRVFVERARDPVPQSFKANAQVSLAVKTLNPIASSHNVSIEVVIDRKLDGPKMPVAAYIGIVINLVSNALKALVPKIGKEGRNIRIYATNDLFNHILVVSDNGVGIPAYLRNRIWDPLFSTTPGNDEDNPLGTGLGLGLSVVSQVVKKMKGKIELLDDASNGFMTSFKVTLPLDQ